jgi:hypothetical protein
MKYGQKLKVGYAHVTPRNIQELQASKLGDALRHPFFIGKKQVTFQHTIFLLLHALCVFLGASLLLLSVFFCFVCCSKWLDTNKFLLEDMYFVFHSQRTLHFLLLSFNECSLFLELHLAFIFCLDLCFMFRSCYIFASRCIWTTGLCWYSSKELFQKGLNGVGKEKKFYAKSGTKKRLFRLRLRLLHAVLDVVLIVCLVIFAVA